MNLRNLFILSLLALGTALLTGLLSMILPPVSSLLYIIFAPILFVLLFILFDRYLWRWLPFETRPDISGDWLGQLISSYSENSEIEPIRVRIVQTWFMTRIDFIARYSSSSSAAAVFFRDAQGRHIVAYIYRSEPYEGHEETVPAHIGLTVLNLLESGRLSGYYHHMLTKPDGIEFRHGQLVLTRSASPVL